MTAWTTADERFIQENAGLLTLREMADVLDRSYESVRYHAHVMRQNGRLDSDLRIYGEDNFISDLTLCVECLEPRSTCDANQVCKVCRDRALLENHIELMYRAYANLPRELQEKTNGTFEIQRTKSLMKSKLEKPKKPTCEGLDAFWSQKAMDDWHRAMEAYELRLLKLDIDAAKQRRSKWKRKAAKYRAEREGRY